jgi:hypothetical protein
MKKKILEHEMLTWLVLAALFYLMAALIVVPASGGYLALVQTGLFKAGHVFAGGYIGYWLNEHRSKHFGIPSTELSQSILMVGAMLTMGMGL